MLKKQLISLVLIGSLLTPATFATAYDASDFVYEVYTQTIQDKTEFTIDYAGPIEELGDVLPLIKQGIRLDEYRYYALGAYEVFSDSSAEDTKVRIILTRNTPAENEAYVNQYVEKTLKDLKLEGLSDYWRARKIAEHLSIQFEYDKSEQIHDPFNLIQTRTGVCQAYALLFYKMALAAGLEVRHQEGSITGGNHLWNVVKIKDKWFHVDPTNNDFNASYSLFLKSNDFLRSKSFTWTALVEPVVETDADLPDQYYNSGTYSEGRIMEILEKPSPVYDKPDDALEDLAVIRQQYTYRTVLQAAMDVFASEVNQKNYLVLKTEYVKALKPNGKLETKAAQLMATKRAENRKRLEQVYLPYAKAVVAANKKPDLKAFESAIQLGTATAAKLKQQTLDEGDISGYLTLIESNKKQMSAAMKKLPTPKPPVKVVPKK